MAKKNHITQEIVDSELITKMALYYMQKSLLEENIEELPIQDLHKKLHIPLDALVADYNISVNNTILHQS